MRKRLMGMFLAALLLIPGMALAGAGAEQTPVEVTVNGFSLEGELRAEEGIALVAVESFCRSVFGGGRCAVDDSAPLAGSVLCRWAEDGSGTLTITRSGDTGEPEQTLTLELGSAVLRTGGASSGEVRMDRPLEWADGAAWAPLEPVAKALGFQVRRSGETICLEREKRRVTVRSLEEFLNAVGDDTEITLAPGVYDFGALEPEKIQNPLVLIDYEVFNTETGSWYGGDRWQAVIRQVRDLTIRASGVTFSTPWAYADVLRFQDCRRVTLTGATAVHDVEPGHCTGNCLELIGCGSFRAEDCVLDGSGAYGLCAVDSRDVTLRGCEIANCTYGALELEGSEEVRLLDCRIHDCLNCFSLVSAADCAGVLIRDCALEGNTANSLASSGGSTGVCFQNCTFRNDRFGTVNEYGWQESGGAVLVDCVWQDP